MSGEYPRFLGFGSIPIWLRAHSPTYEPRSNRQGRLRINKLRITPPPNLVPSGSGSPRCKRDVFEVTYLTLSVLFAAIYSGPLETCALPAVGVLYCARDAYGKRAKPFAPEVRWTQIDSNDRNSPSTACGVTTDPGCFAGEETTTGNLALAIARIERRRHRSHFLRPSPGSLSVYITRAP